MDDPRYERRAPSAQTAADVFPAWYTALPNVQSGNADLLHDPRITWLIDQAGGIADKTVLEIGPLEGAHTAMLLAAGAQHVTAVEANRGAWLRCLATKEILGLRDAAFLCGDARAFMSAQPDRAYAFALACGVLYHQPDPASFLRTLCRVADCVLLNTHIFDPDHPTPFVAQRLDGVEPDGTARMLYRAERNDPAFCGGSNAYARWMRADAIVATIESCGFRIQATRRESHILAPLFALVAHRS